VTAERRCGEGAKGPESGERSSVGGASRCGSPAVLPERSVDRCCGTELWIRAAETGRDRRIGRVVGTGRSGGAFRAEGRMGRGRITGTDRRPSSWLWGSGFGPAPWRRWDETVGVEWEVAGGRVQLRAEGRSSGCLPFRLREVRVEVCRCARRAGSLAGLGRSPAVLPGSAVGLAADLRP
jgi:hypothetical protein